ncbi:hypothetical protein NW759_012313 [Fusarium solani]|nr:hypothetical protein NW759_012313 [Fusarium solani]
MQQEEHAEIEPKALIVIQALFLLSFWRAGALLQKDTRHWLGAAVSLAQTKALHRSPRGVQDELQRLRKRIWWSIYIQGSRRYVTEHRAKLCLLALQELQKTWEVKNWILQVFFQYLDRPTAARLQLGEDWSEAPRLATETHPLPATSPWAPPESYNQDTADVTDTTGATASEGPWNMSKSDAEQFLYSQIENRFVNREGGAIDWYMADLVETALPS